ncbi:LysR family transcriptional regulator [Ornithinimicrobium faecis]|uniref:LysR family transcriptional regulator n=1 Tax=Ornithinimicrobium faecis TaxID=2934158 RepID=A0ABY4YTE8_9MICO|nr:MULTISPECIES: LysR family transcriptional regulator [unclassified Ornithinimicrobium]USQ80009.1 LysR family transcriptional regulator [Ornithinimicrobium sp. HY1793]
MIDVQRLRVWQAVVASGSVHAAARHLGYTPSTVSQHVKLLARETGLVLATRVGRGIEPTAAGLRLAEEGSEVISSLGRLDHVVSDLRDGRTDHLSIACFASVAQTWVPEVAERLRHELPGVVLEVSISEPHGGRGRRAPDLEVASEAPDEAGSTGAAFVRHDLGLDPFVVALPVGHRLASADEVRVAELADETWIDNVVYDSPTLRILVEACRAAGFQPQFAARCDDHQATLGLVAAGLGITGLPSLAAHRLPDGVVAVPLVDPVPQRRIVANQRHLTAHTRASAVALEALQQLATQVRE